MITHPSFAALFRQSRYARSYDDSTKITRQNRTELFTVASVAFVMEHDPAFRRTFLKQICDVAACDLDNKFEIEIQPAFHADLRIRCKAQKAIFIVEFKVGAKLMTKQDFSRGGEFLKKHKGYGWKMLNDQAYKDCCEKTYVVLQKQPGFKDGDVKHIRVRSRTWKDLVSDVPSESSLVSDLLDTIGGWEIPALKFRKTTGMKKAPQTKDAADIYQIITTVAEQLGVSKRKMDFDVQSGTDGVAFFGLNIPRGLKGFSHLEKIAKKHGGALGWFGYSAWDDGKTTLDLWIYCSPSKAVDSPAIKTMRYVERRVSKLLNGVKPVKVEEDCVHISVGGNAIPDDREWFKSIFDALQRKT